MSQCTFPNKNVSRLLWEGSKRGKWPKVLKKLLHFPFSELLLYITTGSLSLPRCLASLTAVLQSPITHSWLAGASCIILFTTEAREVLLLFQPGECVGRKCWLSPSYSGEEGWGSISPAFEFYYSLPYLYNKCLLVLSKHKIGFCYFESKHFIIHFYLQKHNIWKQDRTFVNSSLHILGRNPKWN